MTKITEEDDVQNINKNRYRTRVSLFLQSPSQGGEGAYDSNHRTKRAIEPIK